MNRSRANLLFVFLAAAASATAQGIKKPEAESTGPLLLIGGRHQDLSNQLREVFFDLAGGKNARIVVIPTGVADVQPDRLLKPWQEVGPQSVQILHTRDRKQADDPAFTRPLTEATAVFITNGHLHRVLDVYRGTLVERELQRLQARDGLLGGTGSGAAALCELVSIRADNAPPAQAGLGTLPGFLFDDAGRLEEAVAANPAQVGLAIEPGAAVEIRGQDLRVLGSGTVTIRLAKGAGLDAKVDVLKPGAMWNVNELRRAAASRVDKPQGGKEQPPVVRDQVKGSINHGDGKTEWQRITGKARALDAHTLEFDDGTRIDLDIAVPEPNQMGLIGDALYPAGKEAAEFLGKLVADRPVMCFQGVRGDGPWMGYVGDTNLERAMVVGGWALADHSSLHADEIIARESQRGLWRGKFVHPDDWRAGLRLPGEPPPPKLTDEVSTGSILQFDIASALISAAAQEVPQQFSRDKLVDRRGEAWARVTGKATVIDAQTLEFEDGTRVALDFVAPHHDQMGMIGDSLYACGKEAAEFLRKLIGDRPVTCFRNTDRDREAWIGIVDDTLLDHAMIAAGWGLANQRHQQVPELSARESKRGLWRGKFIDPIDWEAGVRLPGEPAPAKLVDELEADKLLHSHGGRGVALATLIDRIVQDIPDARRLNLSGTGLSDDQLAKLTNLTRLEELYLHSTPLSDAGLAPVRAFSRLKRLALPSSTPAVTIHLKDLTSLEWLQLTSNNTEASLAHLKGLTGLKHLDLAWSGTTDAGLQRLAQLTNLDELRLGLAGISDAGLAHLKDMHRLRRLALYGTKISDAGLFHLRDLKYLEVLDIHQARVTDAGLAHLKGLANLQYLDLTGNDITDAGIVQLLGLKKLKVLRIPDGVTEKGMQRFRAEFPALQFNDGPHSWAFKAE